MGRKKKINEILPRLTIERIGSGGKSIAHHEGRVVFVAGGIPGDIADVQVTRKKAKFYEGHPVVLHEASSLRTEPFCQHFGTCGGCKWQHLKYEAQLAAKQQEVTDALERIAQVPLPEVQPIKGSALTRHYRNKLEFTFTANRWLTAEEIVEEGDIDRRGIGFHLPGRFDRVLDIETCWLQDPVNDRLRNTMRQLLRKHNLSCYNNRTRDGFLRNLMVRTTSTGQVMALLQVAHEHEVLPQLLKELHEFVPEITSLLYVINSKGNDTFGDLPVHTFAGTPYIEEELEDLRYRINPKSFFQTNTAQALELYRITRELAQLTGTEVVYDLYSGTGTIGLFVAKQAAKVVGIEYVPEATADAEVNAQLNNISNCRFFAGDMKAVFSPELVQQEGQPDVVITDPPRAGMAPEVVARLLELEPKRIVYVSCNPATQARDVALLDAKYSVAHVQPVDMFPHTYHVENVLLLVRK